MATRMYVICSDTPDFEAAARRLTDGIMGPFPPLQRAAGDERDVSFESVVPGVVRALDQDTGWTYLHFSCPDSAREELIAIQLGAHPQEWIADLGGLICEPVYEVDGQPTATSVGWAPKR